MERLTSRNEDCVSVNGHGLYHLTMTEVVQMADRLAAYEDTGREPEEVTALGKLFDYALKESKTLTEQLTLLKHIRELAEADEDMTAAQLYFYQWQAAFNQLTQAISHIKDEDKAGKLCAAIRAQLAAWGKTMEDTQ